MTRITSGQETPPKENQDLKELLERVSELERQNKAIHRELDAVRRAFARRAHPRLFGA
jgi:cell shape-determining protein MreC